MFKTLSSNSLSLKIPLIKVLLDRKKEEVLFFIWKRHGWIFELDSFKNIKMSLLNVRYQAKKFVHFLTHLFESEMFWPNLITLSGAYRVLYKIMFLMLNCKDGVGTKYERLWPNFCTIAPKTITVKACHNWWIVLNCFKNSKIFKYIQLWQRSSKLKQVKFCD